jgi:hypothetical protein
MDTIHRADCDQQHLDYELDLRALRSAVWISVREAQRLHLLEVVGQLCAILVYIDGLLETAEAAAA